MKLYILLFDTGTFLARQSQFIPCGYSKAILSILIRFIVGPILMAITSFIMGLHGTLLHIAIVQVQITNHLSRIYLLFFLIREV